MYSLILLLKLFTTQHFVPANHLPVQSDSITIFGSCWDIATGVDLKVRITADVNGKKIFAGESNNEGTFDVPIPASTSGLTFEATGYRTIITPIHVLGKSEKGDRFRVYFKMIALDSQQVARPVNSLPKDKTQSAQEDDIPKSHFQVRDAYLGKPLTAKICLTFTRTGRTYCLDTDSTSAPTASFVGDLENIDLKVTSNGFQDYEGKLKLLPTQKGDVFYQIKLLKVVLPILTMKLNGPDSLQIEYRSKGGAFVYLPYIKGRPWKELFNENEPVGEQTMVAVQVGSNTVLGSESYTVKPGLNFKAIRIRDSGPQQNIPIAANKGITSKRPTGAETELSTITVKAKLTERRRTNTPDVLADSTATGSFTQTTLYFDQSSYILRTNTKLTLDSISEFLRKQRNLKAQVTGHTDNVGSRNLNVSLSEYRARVVANYLQQKGVQSQQIVSRWKGPDLPVASNDNEANKVKNRRVEIEVVPR